MFLISFNVNVNLLYFSRVFTCGGFKVSSREKTKIKKERDHSLPIFIYLKFVYLKHMQIRSPNFEFLQQTRKTHLQNHKLH